MASGKLSPRQKMINMMYLVLTALLALNISRDVLKAFYKVQVSLDQVVTNLSEKNDKIYLAFEDAADKNPTIFEAPRDIARQVKKESAELINHLNIVKQNLIDKTGGMDEEPSEDGVIYPNSMDNKEVAANYLLVANESKGKKAEGKVMKEKINKFRDFMLGLEPVRKSPDLQRRIKDAFNTDDKKAESGGVRPWENYTFEELPLVSITTFISKIEGDVVTLESEVIESMFNGLVKNKFNFSGVEATVIAPKTYIMQGDSFTASIFLTAFDKTQKPTIEVTEEFNADGEPNWEKSYLIENVDDQGKGQMSVKARTTGKKKFASRIELTTNDGKQYYEKQFEYDVASPTAVVSPTKMNVFYKGVPNPIEVSVPGYEPEKITLSGMSGIKFKSNGPGSYDVIVDKNAKKETKITVRADGQQVGEPKEFRIKRIPNPTATIAGKIDGPISKSLLMRTPGIRSTLLDFPFDLDYKVSSYTVRIKDGEYTIPIKVKGNLFTQPVKDKIAKLKSGSDVSFTNIKAKGPDGNKTCAPVVLTIQ